MAGDQIPSRRAFLAVGGLLLAGCRSVTQRVAGSSPTPTTTSPSAAPASRATAPGVPVVVRHGATGRPEVALTFHGSGDPALAERALVAAESSGAAVTIFAVGTWLRTNPTMAARILRGGHALGNHTYTHPTLHRLTPTAIGEEVARCAELLRRQIGTVGCAFRPSGGPSVTEPMVSAAARSGYAFVVGYDVDPEDNTDPGAAAVAQRVLAGVRAGSIVSLHLGHSGTVDALPRILAGLASRGLRAVTVPALLAPA
ncbi:MAG: polysaccharide deacetylase family protein [Mycobacteriales bacterium]